MIFFDLNVKAGQILNKEGNRKKDNLCQGQESHFAFLSSYSVKSCNLISTVLLLTTVNCIFYLFCLKHSHIK